MTKQQDRTGEFSSKVYLEMELLRFTTAGSVDDGKSTLIGRLLYDSKSIFEDQLDAVKKASLKKGSKHLNLQMGSGQSGSRGSPLMLPTVILQHPAGNLLLPILPVIFNIPVIWLPAPPRPMQPSS